MSAFAARRLFRSPLTYLILAALLAFLVMAGRDMLAAVSPGEPVKASPFRRKYQIRGDDGKLHPVAPEQPL